MKVKSPGGRDPGFKLVFGWEPRDILGIQFTVKVAELSEAGGWFSGCYVRTRNRIGKIRTGCSACRRAINTIGAPKACSVLVLSGQLGGWEAFSLRRHPGKHEHAPNVPLGMERCEA